MESDDLQGRPGDSSARAAYLCLIGTLVAGAVIWLTISPPQVPRGLFIALLAVGVAAACACIGAGATITARQRDR